MKSIGHSASSAECRYNLELTSLLDTTLVACDNRDETGSLATTTLSDLKAYTQHVQHSSDETSLSPDVSQSRQLSDVCTIFLSGIKAMGNYAKLWQCA